MRKFLDFSILLRFSVYVDGGFLCRLSRNKFWQFQLQEKRLDEKTTESHNKLISTARFRVKISRDI